MKEIITEIHKCQSCDLHKTTNKKVIGRGSYNPKYLFIGEAPGSEEEKQGVPFVGKSGKLLEEWIKYLGIKDDEYAIINCVKCRPPENRDPTFIELERCEFFLKEQIKFLNPKNIIILGRIALNLLTIETKITSVAGKKVRAKREKEYLKGINIYAMPHPSYYLRNGYLGMENDLKKLKKELTTTDKPLISLHNHTTYSVGDGLTSLEELIDYAVKNNHPAVAISDHGTISGWYKFGKLCKEKKIKPLFGVEFYVEYEKKRYHFLALAKDNNGIENLLKLNAIAYENFYRKPVIKLKDLITYRKGLIVATACLGGLFPQFILKESYKELESFIKLFKESFGDDFYLEYQLHELDEQKKVNEVLKEYSKKYQIKTIITLDIHYLTKKDKKIHSALKSIAYKTKYGTSEFRTDNHYYTQEDIFSTIDKVGLTIEDYQNSVDNIYEIIEKCNATFDFNQSYFPKCNLKIDIEEYCVNRLKELNLYREPYISRLEKELQVIKEKGFEEYFLIIKTLIDYSNENNILVGPGRGSAVGSLVVYLLGITKVDPIKYGLLFERFLDPERPDNPDIDLDFQHTRRDEIYKYLEETYGEDHVCRIVTFGKFHLKQALRDVSRILDIPLSEVNWVAKKIGDQAKTYEEALEIPEFQKFLRKYPKLSEIVPKLINRIRHRSLHAAGVVVTPRPLSEIISYEKVRGVKVSPFDKDDLDDMGILKLDILALKTLDIISKALKSAGLTQDDLPLEFDDPEVFKIFREGKTLGVFQFKSNLLTQISRRLRISNFKELYDATTIARPGPLHSGQTEQYIRRCQGIEPVEYVHESLEEITKDSYGLLLYQEQIMLASIKLANFSFSEANRLRKVISKTKGVEEMDKYKEKFIQGCISNNIPEKIANIIWDSIREAGKYSFNKSHAVAYSVLSYWCAWLRRYYPREWLVAVASIEEDFRRKALYELVSLGEEIHLPDINKSERDFEIIDGKVYMGLISIDGVGEKAVEEIIKNRPYKNFEDFYRKVERRKVNIRVIEKLIVCGCFDGLEDRHVLYESIFDGELPRDEEELIRLQDLCLDFSGVSGVSDYYDCPYSNIDVSRIKDIDYTQDNLVWIKGVIKDLEVRKVRNDRIIYNFADTHAHFMAQDSSWEILCYVSPEIFYLYKDYIDEGAPVLLRGFIYENLEKLFVDMVVPLSPGMEVPGFLDSFLGGKVDRILDRLGDGYTVIESATYNVSRKGNPYVKLQFRDGNEGLLFKLPKSILMPGTIIKYTIVKPPFINVLETYKGE